MMTKTFNVSDDTQITVGYSAYTPILYRELHGRDYFEDVSEAVAGTNVMDNYFRFAYTGAYMAADGKDIGDFREWLDQYNLVDFVTVLSDIWSFMNQNSRSTSKSKKK